MIEYQEIDINGMKKRECQMNGLYDGLTDEEIISKSKQLCRDKGMDPALPPTFTCRFSEEQLIARQKIYMECIELIHYFVGKFLASVSDNPILIEITDDEGYVLELIGNPSILETVRLLGIREGVRYNEDDAISSIQLCLLSQRPFQVIGSDHYHHALHRIACYSAPFYHEGGQRIAGTLSLMTDIDYAHPHLMSLLSTIADSVERELMLRKQNSQLHILNQLLMETKYYGVLITDPAGNVVQMNDNMMRILNLNSANKRAYLGVPVFGINEIGCYFRKVIEDREQRIGQELSITINGTIHYYILDVLPVYDLNCKMTGVVGSLRDITDIKNTEELLRNTEKLVFAGQLAVSIAHEVRNPLTTVKGMLQLCGQEAKLRHYNLIMSELERMNLIVSELMILGKPQAVQFKQEQCETILKEVLNVFGIQATLNHVMIRTERIHSQEITCDRNQIKQVFLNILKNSMEALPFGGNINIVLDVQDNCQVISFTDNGLGMAGDVLARIGEPFHTTKLEGNGLGMMIVQKILDTHKGRMTISSDVGQGTTVTIYLPLAINNNNNVST